MYDFPERGLRRLVRPLIKSSPDLVETGLEKGKALISFSDYFEKASSIGLGFTPALKLWNRQVAKYK